MTTIDVLIPTLNASELLRHCLLHLARSRYTDFRVIVYDDGSIEDTRSVVSEIYPSATVIRSDVNRGLAYGMNRAIDAGTSPFVVLLNNDVEVTQEWLGELIACAQRHPCAGSIASKIRLFSDRARLHSAGDFYSYRGIAGNRGVWLEDTGQFDAEIEVFAACGAAALYRREALNAIRGSNGAIFDERLYMYYEDVDIAWRLQRAGFPCVFAYQATVYHRLSATGGGRLASYHVARNALLVLRRSVPAEFRTRHRSRILAHHLGRFVATLPRLREPAARATVRGALAGAIGLTHARTTMTALSASERERIDALLAHSATERFRGVPVARLRTALAGSGKTVTVTERPGRLDSA